MRNFFVLPGLSVFCERLREGYDVMLLYFMSVTYILAQQPFIVNGIE